MQSVYLFTATIIAVHSSILATDVANEALTVKVTNQAQLYSVFNFSLISSYNGVAEGYHYHLFPRNIGNLVKKYNVAEFHLSMTQGLWRYESWGYPDFPAPPGAQLWVWFHHNVKDVDAAWKGFANALSGLLCASLNFIGKTETVSPHLSFKPEGYLSGNDRRFIRYAVLPRENLCTENLTPWLKLLPCGSSAGIARLIEPATLHHSRYLSLGLDFKYTCEQLPCVTKGMELYQSVSTVFDLQVGPKGKPDFSIEDILGRRLKGGCPLTSSSLIRFAIPQGVSLQPAPTYSDSVFKVYDLLNMSKPGNIKAKWTDASSISVTENNPYLLAHCHITGIGHQDGGIQCQITNTANQDIQSIVMQTVPWFLQVYLHTFKITNENGKQTKAENLTFRPAKIRESPHFIEYQINVPTKSTLTIAMQFTRGFLTWTEHPPDANHGFYIGSTVISVNGQDIGLDDDETHRIYSEIIQVTIPVPDFSMPYNVICLACTVVAIAFGSLHNLTTRIYQKVDPDDDKKSLVSRIKDKLSSVKTLVTGRPKVE